MTPFNRSGSKRAKPPKFTISTYRLKLSSPHDVIFQFIVYYYVTKPPKKLKATLNAVVLAMDLLLSSQVRKHR